MSIIDIKIILWYIESLMNATRSTPRTAVHGLAVFGFIALITTGIWLAIYSARFVPATVGSLSAAAISLSQVFSPARAPSLSVVPLASSTLSTTISFGESSSPITPTTTVPATAKPSAPQIPGQKTGETFPMSGGIAPAVLSGLPDLTVHIDGVGYLASSSADSFVAAGTVPVPSRPAVKFTITNIGKNVAGPWRWSAMIPTQSSYLYQSQLQQPLNPGDSIEYTLGFDQANRGSGQLITVTANFDRAVSESDLNNNTATASVTILGS